MRILVGYIAKLSMNKISNDALRCMVQNKSPEEIESRHNSLAAYYASGRGTIIIASQSQLNPRSSSVLEKKISNYIHHPFQKSRKKTGVRSIKKIATRTESWPSYGDLGKQYQCLFIATGSVANWGG